MSFQSTSALSPPNYELLKDAYAIIGGIPEEAFDLDAITTHEGKNISCGTICCAIGWLGHHPQFRALGLKTGKTGVLTFKDKPEFFEYAAAEIFNISQEQALNLFGHNRVGGMFSHKKIWMCRVKTFLKIRGQLKSQLRAKAK